MTASQSNVETVREVAYETENYMVCVGKAVHTDSPHSFTTYQIINRKYGVIEMEHSGLPMAIDIAQNLERDLVNIRARESRKLEHYDDPNIIIQ